MSKRKCGTCGKDPAEGFASVWSRATGEVFYCHGDDDEVSCYESQGWPRDGSVATYNLSLAAPSSEPTP